MTWYYYFHPSTTEEKINLLKDHKVSKWHSKDVNSASEIPESSMIFAYGIIKFGILLIHTAWMWKTKEEE